MFDLWPLEVIAYFGSEEDTSSILLVQFTVQGERFRIDMSLQPSTWANLQICFHTENLTVNTTPFRMLQNISIFKLGKEVFTFWLRRGSVEYGNFSLNVSFMSFFRSDGFTYLMTVVWKRSIHISRTKIQFQMLHFIHEIQNKVFRDRSFSWTFWIILQLYYLNIIF